MKITDTIIEKEDVLQNGIKIGVNTVVKLISESGAVVKRSESFDPISVSNEAKMYRVERQQKIDKLIYDAKNADTVMKLMNIPAGLENIILVLFKHYKEEMGEYIQLGIDSFFTAVNTESDTQIKTLLDKEVPRSDGNGMITIKQSIFNALQ